MQNEPVYARCGRSAPERLAACAWLEAAEAELVEAIRRAAPAMTHLNPRFGARVAAEPPPGLRTISPSGVEVLRMVAYRHTNTEIAERLFLSVRTVETYRAHIQQKPRIGSGHEPCATAPESTEGWR